MKIDIVLVEPNTSGNVGAVARAMKNFGFEDLVLINPRCNHLSKESLSRAMHAKDIINKARVKLHYDDYDYKIASTSVIGGDYNIPRSPLTPEELASKLEELKGVTKIALVFGREDRGLTTEEISSCDFVLTIPTTPDYPAMNLSHSVSIILYELSKSIRNRKLGEAITPIGKKEKTILLKLIDETIDNFDWRTDSKKETQYKVWRRLIGKGMLTNREAVALMGFFRKIK